MNGRALRANALFHFLLGLLLLAATWDALYDALGLPPAQALFAQIGGTVLLAFAYLLWIAPRNAHLTQAVAGAAALANGLATLVVLIWLLADQTDSLFLWGLAPVLAAFAVIEGWIASRSASMLMPGD